MGPTDTHVPTRPGVDAAVTPATVQDAVEAVRRLNEVEQGQWRRLIRSWALVIDALDRDLNALGISLEDYEVLAHLSEAPDERLRMFALAELALMSRSRLTYRVQRLVGSGYVRREPCRTDRRGAFAVLTDDGRSVLRNAAPTHVTGVRELMMDSGNVDDWRRVDAVMSRVISASEATLAGPPRIVPVLP